MYSVIWSCCPSTIASRQMPLQWRWEHSKLAHRIHPLSWSYSPLNRAKSPKRISTTETVCGVRTLTVCSVTVQRLDASRKVTVGSWPVPMPSMRKAHRTWLAGSTSEKLTENVCFCVLLLCCVIRTLHLVHFFMQYCHEFFDQTVL